MRAYIQCRGGGGRGEGLYSGCNWIKFFCLQVDGAIHGALLYGGTHKWQFTLRYFKSKVVHTDYQIIVFSFIDHRKCHNFGKNVLDQ